MKLLSSLLLFFLFTAPAAFSQEGTADKPAVVEDAAKKEESPVKTDEIKKEALPEKNESEAAGADLKKGDEAKQKKAKDKEARKAKQKKKPLKEGQKERETAAEGEKQPKDSEKPHGGLLLIEDEDFKYLSVPGISRYRKDAKKSDISGSPDEEAKGRPEKEKKKDDGGLFGLSKDTTSSMAKIFILFLILIAFLLYKARSRGSSRRVVRTYPKK
ncbi:MAG: hypothetical protein MUD12_08320 [Spirochaetes bacterium]|jgi:hypothetical protein|nr:hypothetical protein [Spirochaetota bacterium]